MVSEQSLLAAQLQWATQTLRNAGLDTPEVDAQLLAAHLLGCSRGRVQTLALVDEPAPAGYRELVQHRAQRIPLQHLTGEAYFYGEKLRVGPGVFIPRPETELLVDTALQHFTRTPRQGSGKVLDACTGSGAIAKALATQLPQRCPGTDWEFVAIELSQTAFNYAEQNLAETPVRLVQADATAGYAPWVGEVDLFITNPPYVPQHLPPEQVEARDFDPPQALYSPGQHGQQIPQRLAEVAATHLRAGGLFLMEHHETQAELLCDFLSQELGHSFQEISSHCDYTGRARFISAIKVEE